MNPRADRSVSTPNDHRRDAGATWASANSYRRTGIAHCTSRRTAPKPNLAPPSPDLHRFRAATAAQQIWQPCQNLARALAIYPRHFAASTEIRQPRPEPSRPQPLLPPAPHSPFPVPAISYIDAENCITVWHPRVFSPKSHIAKTSARTAGNLAILGVSTPPGPFFSGGWRIPANHSAYAATAPARKPPRRGARRRTSRTSC